MRVLVADASSLILLAKAQVLASLAGVAQLLVPAGVFEEVCGPEQLGRYPDAQAVMTLVAQERLLVQQVRRMAALPATLGRGESEAVSLFVQERADAVLTDDGRAIRVCRIMGIPYTTSPRCVVDMFRMGELRRRDARDAIERLAVHGRYSPDVVAAAIQCLAQDSEEDE